MGPQQILPLRAEWTWEKWLRRGTPHSLDFLNWNLTIKCSLVSYLVHAFFWWWWGDLECSDCSTHVGGIYLVQSSKLSWLNNCLSFRIQTNYMIPKTYLKKLTDKLGFEDLLSVRDIVVENRICDSSSNPEQGCSGKAYFFLSPAMDK